MSILDFDLDLGPDGKLQHNYVAVCYLHVHMSNPNGDPDNDNQPRTTPSRHGYMTTGCIKHKTRHYLETVDGEPLFIQSEGTMNDRIAASAVKSGLKKKKKGKGDESGEDSGKITIAEARAAQLQMCNDYIDVRWFGGVMNTGDVPIGQIRGAVQVGPAESIAPIRKLPHVITRQSKTREKDPASTMGRNALVTEAMYRYEIFINAGSANKNGFTAGDLQRVIKACIKGYDYDRSACRTGLNVAGLVLYEVDQSQILECHPQHLPACVPNTDEPNSMGDYDIHFPTIKGVKVAFSAILNKRPVKATA